METFLLIWIQNFLSNCRQKVCSRGSASNSWSPVISGVPQGSVLGPILFVVYMNDLPDIFKSNLWELADDTKLLYVTGFEKRYLFHTFDTPANIMM